MADRVREQLLGYLLGALDEPEQVELEGQLAQDPALRKELALVRRELEPLRRARAEFDLPFGLAARTCEAIFSDFPDPALPKGRPETEPIQLPRPPSPPEPVAAPVRPWTPADLAVSAAILLAAALLVFPALVTSRYASRVLDCQNRLRQFGIGLVQYSNNHQGYFPDLPARGPLSFAGVVAPRLREAGYLDDPSLIWCPGCAGETRPRGPMPTTRDLLTASPAQLRRLRQQAGGDYAYALGYWQSGRYHTPRNLGRRDYVILADAPRLPRPDRGSLNHCGRGQNVVFEDGRVVFLPFPRPPGGRDNFYTNNLGVLAAGQSLHDSVVGPSGVVPVRLPTAPLPTPRNGR